MTHEAFVIFGLILGALTVPSILSAIKDGGSPRIPSVMIVISGGMVLYGMSQLPTGVTLTDLPAMFDRVVNSIF